MTIKTTRDTSDEAADALLKAARALHEERLVAGAAGNLTMRLGPDQVLATPRGVQKSALTPGALITLDLNGRQPKGSNGRPSSEIQVHLQIYGATALERVAAIVHAHPIAATALAAKEGLNLCVSAEGAATIGPVAQIAYARPGTLMLARLCARAAADGAQALLLAHHGAVTLGPTIEQAQWRMSALEHVSAIWLLQHQAGLLRALPDEEVAALRRQAGFVASWPSQAKRYGF